jgi:hypothetical protein
VAAVAALVLVLNAGFTLIHPVPIILKEQPFIGKCNALVIWALNKCQNQVWLRKLDHVVGGYIQIVGWDIGKEDHIQVAQQKGIAHIIRLVD